MRRFTVLSAISITTFALAWPSSARAGVSVGADMNVGVVTNGVVGELGSGARGRVGYRLNLGFLALTPEVGAGYLRLREGEAPVRVFAGGELALRGFVQPSVHAHYGYSWVRPGQVGPTYNLGGALDLSVPPFRVGVHAGYVVVDSRVDRGAYVLATPVQWVELGLHTGLAF